MTRYTSQKLSTLRIWGLFIFWIVFFLSILNIGLVTLVNAEGEADHIDFCRISLCGYTYEPVGFFWFLRLG